MEQFKELDQVELTVAFDAIFDKPCYVTIFPHYFIISVGVGEDDYDESCDGNVEVYPNGTMEVSSYNFSVPFVKITEFGKEKGWW